MGSDWSIESDPIDLHIHHPGIIPTSDTERYGVPSSCANGPCHADRPTDWLQPA